MAEALIEGIEKDAQKEAEQLLSEAKQRAEDTVRGAQSRAEGILKDAEKKAEERSKLLADRESRSTEAEVKRLRLKARDELRREILALVRRRLRTLPEREDYDEIILSWLEEAAIGTGAKHTVVYAGFKEQTLITPELLKRAEKESGIKVSLAEEQGSDLPEGLGLLSGRQGVIVTDSKRRVVYDNSVEARIGRLEGALRRMIDRELQ
ncbi:V-type ATP synthase subunit E [Sediminispirochaeta smaragdinae]|uniref:V-type ATP synthase subunit E n=1 Tax=Sediminispirochaeta smaragdinae (strain DSM 11293 / JCM 15392 / SEBR 4228) TaxID=573413 RepID=E1R4W9_SEDSS|nr:V-type ATP synthase subunit E family protein [Sediminispirochaeta smaragdinae]ADK82207.1 H+transporting two-sector ATPase E subunit [Sediminispirochaeta smaragdinae DSM 11293]